MARSTDVRFRINALKRRAMGGSPGSMWGSTSRRKYAYGKDARFGYVSESRVADTWTKTTCGYCSVGCGMLIGTKDGKAVAAYLTERKIPGITFAATRFAVVQDVNRYPYHGQTIEGVRMTVTDRVALDSPELGVEIVSALHNLYPKEFQLQKAAGLVANSETMAGLARGDDPRTISKGWDVGLKEFEVKRDKYLLYR